MADIFISYARSTEAQAQRIAEALRALGYAVWRDDEIPPHRAYGEVIEERLRAAKAVVVVWSTEAVKSQWVRAEADMAREAGTLVQLSLDGAVPPLPFNQIQCAKLADWSGDANAPAWRKIVAGVASLVDGGGGPTPSADPVQLRLIGGFQLVAPDGEPVAIPSRRGRGLLAYLSLAPDHRASRGRLCELLWSDHGEAQARAGLSRCLSELRDTLSAAGLDILKVGRERIALRSEIIASDVAELERVLADSNTDALVVELGSIQDEALLDDLEIGGRFQDWLDQTRPRLERSIAAGVRAHLERLEAARDWPKVRAVAEGYLHRDPLDEAVVAAAIRADAALGHTSAAHRRFQILQAALAKEFGAAPGAAARDAMAKIEASSSTFESRIRAKDEKKFDRQAIVVGPPLVVVSIFETGDAAGAEHKLAQTLRDEVVSGLSRFRDLRVITDPRTLDMISADVSTEWAGAYVLGASLRASLEGSRLVVQLLRLGDRRVIWSEGFAVPGLDVVGTIDGVIAQAVGAVLPTINADLLRRPSNLPADPTYRRYLVAREAAFTAQNFSEAQTATEELEAVISSFPSFALPYLPLAYLYNTDFGCTRAGSSGPEERARALELAKRSLALDRANAHGYTATAWSYLYRRQWAPAETHLEQALSLNPFHASRVMEAGFGLMFLGDLTRARGLLNRCLLLNPAPQDGFFSDLGLMALVEGDHDRAESYLELIADPGVWVSIYSAMNAQMGGAASAEKTHAARDRIAAIWPEGRPMDADGVVSWIANHHPFQDTAVETRFLSAAREMLTRSWGPSKPGF